MVRTCPATIVLVRSWRGRYRRLAVADGRLAGAFEDLTQSLFATIFCSFKRIVRGEVAYLLCQCHGNTQSTIRVSSRTAHASPTFLRGIKNSVRHDVPMCWRRNQKWENPYPECSPYGFGTQQLL